MRNTNKGAPNALYIMITYTRSPVRDKDQL